MADVNRRKQLKSTLYHFYENPVAKVSMELFLSVGLILFLGLFAIRPTLLTMSDLIGEIEDKRELSSQMQRKIAALGTAQNEMRANQSGLSLLDEAIPENPELIYNLKVLEKTAADSRVVIQNIGVSEIPVEENMGAEEANLSLTNLPINVTIVGDYLSIRSFVEALHNNRRAIVIDSVTFSLDSNNMEKELSARIALNFPYFGIKTAKAAN